MPHRRPIPTSLVAIMAPSLVESLEPRIAPATVTFIDVDGDLVTVKTDRGTDEQLLAVMDFANAGQGQQLRTIDFSANAAVFAGTNLTITAKAAVGGDGRVNVGYIDATGADGGQSLSLGKIRIDGDLGRIRAGEFGNNYGVVSLTVDSMGSLGISTQKAGGNLHSEILPGLGSLVIKGDFNQARLDVNGGGGIERIQIGGWIIGGAEERSGSIVSQQQIQDLQIKGSILGGSGDKSGFIQTQAFISSLRIGGDVIGDQGEKSGHVAAFNAIFSTKIGGSIYGGEGSQSGSIHSYALGARSISIGGSVYGGAGAESGVMSSFISGSVKIGGDVLGDSGTGSGSILFVSQGKSTLSVGGSLEGGSGAISGQMVLEDFRSVKIGGSIEGGLGQSSGRLSVDSDTVTVAIGGQVLGGVGKLSGGIALFGAENTKLSIAGDIRGGFGFHSGMVTADLAKSVHVGGEIRGGIGDSSGVLEVDGSQGATIKIGQGIVGGFGANSGALLLSGDSIRSVQVGGSLEGGVFQGSGRIQSNADSIGHFLIKGNLEGSSGDKGARIQHHGDVGNFRISGSLLGGNGLNSGSVSLLGNIGKLQIDGSLSGGSGVLSGSLSILGAGDKAQSVSIGGSIQGGQGILSGTLASGSNSEITKLRIGGPVAGGMAPFAGSLLLDGTSIGSLTILGGLFGGSAFGADDLFQSGNIVFDRAESIKISGNIVSGTNATSGSYFSNDGIRANDSIGKLVITGSIFGASNAPVLITAENGIGSINVKGDVQFSSILSGYDVAGSGIKGSGAVNADAQIGKVVIGGDWLQSNLVAGVQTGNDGFFGTKQDTAIPGGSPFLESRIASIVIRGSILGSPLTPGDSFGFVAQWIDSFKAGKTTLPLIPGPGNDLFPGHLPSPLEPDVRVLEVPL